MCDFRPLRPRSRCLLTVDFLNVSEKPAPICHIRPPQRHIAIIFISTGQAPPMAPAGLWTGREGGREDIVCAWHLSPAPGQRKKERREGKKRRYVSSSPQACLHPPANPPECRHGRLGAVGAGGSPAPERSTAARRAAWWQGRGRRGERGQKRSAGQKNCVSAIMGGWQAGLVLGERQGKEKGRKRGQGSFSAPDPAHGQQPICLPLIAYNRL